MDNIPQDAVEISGGACRMLAEASRAKENVYIAPFSNNYRRSQGTLPALAP
jgi:hypothetical protein